MKNNDYGYVLISDEEEAEFLGLSVQTIRKYHKSLIKKGILEIIEIDGKRIKKFNLSGE